MTDEVCGARHPNQAGVTCELDPASNAVNDDGQDVHVHKGRNDLAVFRWEDATE